MVISKITSFLKVIGKQLPILQEVVLIGLCSAHHVLVEEVCLVDADRAAHAQEPELRAKFLHLHHKLLHVGGDLIVVGQRLPIPRRVLVILLLAAAEQPCPKVVQVLLLHSPGESFCQDSHLPKPQCLLLLHVKVAVLKEVVGNLEHALLLVICRWDDLTVLGLPLKRVRADLILRQVGHRVGLGLLFAPPPHFEGKIY
jgi:hypothetical protein